MILYFEKKWLPGDEITVSFLNGDDQIKKKVRDVAMSIIEESNANITFSFSEESKEKAKIRILFEAKEIESQLGVESLTYRDEEARGANLKFTASSHEALEKWVILHEFGHVLGMVHEIFHPYKTFEIFNDKMWSHYRHSLGSGLSDEEYKIPFNANIGNKFLPNELQFFEFDQDSIMMYEVPASCNDKGEDYPQPGKLSATDIKLLKTFYPKQEQIIYNLEMDKEKEGNLNIPGQQDIYKLSIKDEIDSVFLIKTTSSEKLILSLYTLSKNEKTKGYINYIKPKASENYHNESEGMEAIIELAKSQMSPELREESDFFIRVRHLHVEGTGKYNILFKNKYS